MIVQIRKGEEIIAHKVRVAKTILGRTIGLMFSESLGEYDGLLIQPTNSIHTFFMNYKLDIVFLSGDDEVVSIVRDMKPWRMTRIYFKAYKVLEMNAGTLTPNLKIGDRLEIACSN